MKTFRSATKKIICAALVVVNAVYPIMASAFSYYHMVYIPDLKVRTGSALPIEHIDKTNTSSTTTTVGRAVLRISPSVIDFGGVQVGELSPVQTVTFTNLGSAPLTLGALSTDTQFTVTDSCDGIVVPPLATCQVNVTFSPTQTSLETVTGKLAVPFQAEGSSAIGQASLSGTPTAPFAGANKAAALDGFTIAGSDQFIGADGIPVIQFPIAIINQQSFTRTFDIVSNGDLPVGFTGLSFIDNDGSFSATHDCPDSIPVGERCTVSVLFAPKTLGNKTATLSVGTTSYAGNNMPVKLQGEAIEVYPVYGANSTSSVDFGTLVQGAASATRIVTVSNTGTAPLTVGIPTLSGAISTGLSIASSTCNSPVPVKGTCAISLALSAASTTALDAKLVIPHDGRLTPASPVEVPITGAVVAQTRVLSYSSNPLDFGPSDVSTAYSKTLTVANTGNSPVSGITVTAASPFTVTNGCAGLTVQPGSTCSVTFGLNYATTGPLSRTATISATNLTTTAPQLTVTASMQTRTVSAPTPSTLAFGLQTSQAWSAESTVTVTNTGSVKAAPTVGGRSAQDNTLSGAAWIRVSSDTCAAGVDPGKACTLGFQVKPLSSTNHSATVTIYPDKDLTVRGQSLSVTATGTTQSYTVNETSLDYGVVGSLAVVDRTITVTNTSPAGTTVTGFSYSVTNPTAGSNGGAFSFPSNTCASGIPSASTCTITVRYTAPSYASETPVSTTGGKFSFRFTGARSVDTVIPATISLVGSTVTVTSTNSDFGDTPANIPYNVAPHRSVTVTNTGAYPVTLDSVAWNNTDLYQAEDTTVANRCTLNSTLAAKTSCVLMYYPSHVYTNVLIGPKTSTLTVRASSLGVVTPLNQSVTFTGNVVPASVSSSTNNMDFGNVGERTTQTRTFTFQPSHGGNLNFSGLSVSGTGYVFSTVSPGCVPSTWLSPTSTCTVTIQFAPGAYTASTMTGTAKILANANGQSDVVLATITLTAQVERAKYVVSSNDLNWGDVPSQTPGQTRYAVLKNTSSNAVYPITGKTVAAPFTIGTGTGTYAYNGTNLANCANIGTLNPGVSCYVAVSLSGATGASAGVGAFSGNATLSSNSADGNLLVPMTANFKEATPTLSADNVAFPNPTPTTTTHTPDSVLTVANTSGGRMYWAGSGNTFQTTGNFYIVKSNNSTSQGLAPSAVTNSGRCEEVAYLDAGQSCTLTLRFIPTGATGTKTGNLSIVTTSPTVKTFSVPLSGTAQAGVVSLSNTTVDFGKQLVGSTTAIPLTIRNSGDGPLGLRNFTRVKNDGSPAAYPTEITAANNCTATLPAGQSCDVTVTFTPDRNLNWGTLTTKEAVRFEHYTNGVWSTVYVPLVGEGYGSILTASQHSHNVGYADIAVVPQNYQRTVTFTASGPAPVRITSLNFATLQYLETYSGGTCQTGMTLQPGSSCTVNLRNRADFSNYSAQNVTDFVQSIMTINGTYYKDSATVQSDRSVNLVASVTLVAPLTLTELTPRVVSSAIATEASLFGTGFRDKVSVQLDGSSLPVSVPSGTELRMTIPAGLTVGAHTLLVQNMDGSTLSKSISFTISDIQNSNDPANDVYTIAFDRPIDFSTSTVQDVVVLNDDRKVYVGASNGAGVAYMYDSANHQLAKYSLPYVNIKALRASISGNNLTIAALEAQSDDGTYHCSYYYAGYCMGSYYEYYTYSANVTLRLYSFDVSSSKFTPVNSYSTTLYSFSASSGPAHTPTIQALDISTNGATTLVAYSYTIANLGRTSAVRLITSSGTVGPAYSLPAPTAVNVLGVHNNGVNAYVRFGDKVYTYSTSGTTMTGGTEYQYTTALSNESASGMTYRPSTQELMTPCYGGTAICVIPVVGESLGAAYVLAGTTGTPGYRDGAYSAAQFSVQRLTAHSFGAAIYQGTVPNATRVVKR